MVKENRNYTGASLPDGNSKNTAENPCNINYGGESLPPEHKLSLWYRKPATNWGREALPIGNGFIGGMIFGGICQERIQYNEKTAWDGGPIDGDPSTYNGGNRIDAASYLESVRNKLWAGEADKALEEGNEHLSGLYTHPSGVKIGAYQAFGDIYLNFNISQSINIHDYRRELDLEDGIARVSYTYDGAEYTREYFCSYPDNVLVIKLACSEEGKLNFDIETTSEHSESTITTKVDTITTRGEIYPNKLIIESQIKIINKGGSLIADRDKISVQGSDEVVIIMSAGTNYANIYPAYRGENPHQTITERIKNVSSKTYMQLKETHQKDYKKLFDRVSLELGDVKPIVPTNELLDNYGETQDKSLEVLMYQYGRYLLIASSREGSLPANLQGVWNDSNTPPWRGDYHFNVNIQMNYWPAYVANLTECALPLVDYIESLREPGRISAESHFGVTGGGWTVNCANDIFGYTAPGNKVTYGWAPNSNAFISQDLWEYYEYTKDKGFLKDRIYPIIKEAAKFWSKWLIEDKDGTLVSAPSYSPEQGKLSIAVAMDQQLAYDLFTNVIKGSEMLEVDVEFRAELIEKRSKLSDPIRIGKYGQIQEWKEDIDDEVTNSHRHIAQLVALYPGKLINRETPQWLQAARITLEAREKYTKDHEITGWSGAWKLCLWARAFDGNHTYSILKNQFKASTYSNLFDHCAGPFQIDGNFGFVSGVSEMLLQSHLDDIEFLPTIPDAWSKGAAKGLLARGGYEIDFQWNNKKITQATIKSIKGNNCAILTNGIKVNNEELKITKLSDNSLVRFTLKEGKIVFDTKAGESYSIKFMMCSSNI